MYIYIFTSSSKHINVLDIGLVCTETQKKIKANQLKINMHKINHAQPIGKCFYAPTHCPALCRNSSNILPPFVSLLVEVHQPDGCEHTSVPLPKRKSPALVHLFPSPAAIYFMLNYTTPTVYEVTL